MSAVSRSLVTEFSDYLFHFMSAALTFVARFPPATICAMTRFFEVARGLAGVMVFASVLALLPATAQTDSADKESAPDVPDAIQVPAGETVVLFARGVGSQIYSCLAAEGKFSWTLKGPDAELKDRKDKVIGQHSAGPTWKLKDGSEVTGKATAHVDALDADSVPWLLVNVVSHAGNGALSKVTTIQRVHTHGGKPPADGCDAEHVNVETKSSYTADYYFFAPM
jgi:hypothetical protein